MLLVLTAITFKLQGGLWGQIIEYILTAAEAALMAAFYMQLRRNSPLTRLFAVFGLLWLALLIGGTMTDYLTRF